MKIEHKAAWCVETDIKYTFTVLLILQPQCVMVILYFKWQNFLVSCLSSELFNSVIARGIRASLWVFFPPCAHASELWQQFFSSSLTTKLFGWFLSTQVDVKYEVVVFFFKKNPYLDELIYLWKSAFPQRSRSRSCEMLCWWLWQYWSVCSDAEIMHAFLYFKCNLKVQWAHLTVTQDQGLKVFSH